MYQISLEDDMDAKYQNAFVGGQTYPGSQEYGIHTIRGWGGVLPIPIRYSAELNADQQQAIQMAMDTWSYAVGKNLFSKAQIDYKTGDDFRDLYSSLDDQINGYYMDNNWIKTGKSHEVIATTIWDNRSTDGQQPVITASDIRFNFQHYLIGDSFKLIQNDERSVVDMQSLTLHELGHLLGLGHVSEDVDVHSIMNPSLLIGEGMSNRKLSKMDIERIQKIYGCTGTACDIDSTFYAIERGTNPPNMSFTKYAATTTDRSYEEEESHPHQHHPPSYDDE